MTAPTDPFGLRLYEAFKSTGLLVLLTRRMNYADIQRLKQADRAEAVRLFRGSEYDLLQRLKEDSPEQVAHHLGELTRRQGEAAAAAVVFAGIALMS